MWETVVMIVSVALILGFTEVLPKIMAHRERMAELKNESKDI